MKIFRSVKKFDIFSHSIKQSFNLRRSIHACVFQICIFLLSTEWHLTLNIPVAKNVKSSTYILNKVNLKGMTLCNFNAAYIFTTAGSINEICLISTISINIIHYTKRVNWNQLRVGALWEDMSCWFEKRYVILTFVHSFTLLYRVQFLKAPIRKKKQSKYWSFFFGTENYSQ